MSAFIAVLAALLVVGLLFLAAFCGIGLLALLLQITWPIRQLLHLVRARRAMREFEREYVLFSLPGSPR